MSNLKTQTPASNTGAKWTYNYDDANRLREVIRQDAATNSNIGRSTFGYDGLSRKARAQEYIPSATNNAVWVLQSEVRYVYDGREVIQERDANSVTKVKYVRGLDMGGGIGGLLSRTVVGTGGGTYFYHYDGAGNVCALTDANQNSVAEYRYDAFGNLISSSGSQAAQPYRFSTKEYHAASGFYDFGFRFYSPGMGRWVNRDPIGEAGGLNLYGFTGNSPVNAIDANGLFTFPSASQMLSFSMPGYAWGFLASLSRQALEKEFGGSRCNSPCGPDLAAADRAGNIMATPFAVADLVGVGGAAFAATRPLSYRAHVNPWSVRYTQDSVSWGFKKGGNIGETSYALRNDAADLPAIRVFQKGGKWFTLDNRRLLTYRCAGRNIPIQRATPAEITKEGWKMTTINDGANVFIRNVP